MKITIKVGLSLEAGWLGVACWGLSLSIFSSLIPFGAHLINIMLYEDCEITSVAF